jgi:hypothetical protein
MSHIEEQRLMELAVAAAPDDTEAAHLAACNVCAEAIAAEQGLTAWLATVPQPIAPEGFLACVTRAYSVEMSRRTYRAPVLAFSGIAAMLLPLTVLALSAWTDILASLSSWAVAVRALGVVGVGLMRTVSSPSSPGLTLIALQAALLMAGLGILARLMWMTSPGPEAAR